MSEGTFGPEITQSGEQLSVRERLRAVTDTLKYRPGIVGVDAFGAMLGAGASPSSSLAETGFYALVGMTATELDRHVLQRARNIIPEVSEHRHKLPDGWLGRHDTRSIVGILREAWTTGQPQLAPKVQKA